MCRVAVGQICVQPPATLGDELFLPHELVTDLPDARQEFGAVPGC
jgi:hypothetical protein